MIPTCPTSRFLGCLLTRAVELHLLDPKDSKVGNPPREKIGPREAHKSSQTWTKTDIKAAKVKSSCRAEPEGVAEYQIIQNKEPTSKETNQLKKQIKETCKFFFLPKSAEDPKEHSDTVRRDEYGKH